MFVLVRPSLFSWLWNHLKFVPATIKMPGLLSQLCISRQNFRSLVRIRQRHFSETHLKRANLPGRVAGWKKSYCIHIVKNWSYLYNKPIQPYKNNLWDTLILSFAETQINRILAPCLMKAWDEFSILERMNWSLALGEVGWEKKMLQMTILREYYWFLPS